MGDRFGEPDIVYRDFVVEISPAGGAVWVARVVSSPAGEGECALAWPLTPTQQDWIAEGWDGGSALRDRAAEIGEALFRALLAGTNGRLWAASLATSAEAGLRLKLRFNCHEDLAAPRRLAHLPWELLRDPETRDFLALSRRTPVVRVLRVARPLPPAPRPETLRILVVSAAPAGMSRLDLHREQGELDDAWQAHPEAQLIPLENASFLGLQEALLATTFQGFHFMGHGTFDSASGEGALLFEGSDGGREPVTGERLATLLKSISSLRFVFLNACDTALAQDEGEVDPFASVAAALVLGGIPAVVAMQRKISDRAAVLFSRTFYRSLAAGDPIDAAVTEGRRAIFAAAESSAEWAVPVLFLRAEDGRIFVPDAPSAPRHRPSPRRLGIRLGILTALPLLVAGGWLAARTAWKASRDLDQAAVRDRLRREVRPTRVGSLLVAQREITCRQFQRFVLARPEWQRDRIAPLLHDGNYLKPWTSVREFPAELADHPVTYVPFSAAQAFCRWLGGRLPTRREWQAVAHAERSRYPWPAGLPVVGSAPRLNACDRSCQKEYRDLKLSDGFPETAPVGAFPGGASPEGILDLSGNVWEWCSDTSGNRRITMGGSFYSTFEECSTDRWVWEEARLSAPDGGFRCVWDQAPQKGR